MLLVGRIGPVLGVLCSLTLTGSSLAQPNVVFTEDFDSPSDIDGWSFEPDLGHSVPGGGIQWSASEGQLPGSLELVNPGGGSNTVRAFSICLPFGGDQPWTATVDAKPLDPVICAMQLVNHATADCSDLGFGFGEGSAHGSEDDWVSLQSERPLLFDPAADTTSAIRLELATGNSNQEPGSCVFDNVVITGSLAPPAVAAAGGASLALLAALVAGVGLWLLRLR
jgi:hypothetical protein